MAHNVAVIGATGNVGSKVISYLAERNFPVKKLAAFASSRSEGKKISFGDETLTVTNINKLRPQEFDIFFFGAGSEVSKEFAPKFNRSYFRMDAEIPLIVPEVNGDQVKLFKNKNIIACPNCVAIPVSVVLKPLMSLSKIKRVVITSLQSVSGAGKAAMDELYNQTKARYVNDRLAQSVFKKEIAFNLIPAIGSLEENNYTGEENKVIAEVQKILGENVPVTATCIRVPVFVSHSQSINIEFEDKVTPEKAKEALAKSTSVVVLDNVNDNEFATPLEITGDDDVFVSRIRTDNSKNNTLNLWVVSDNLRKGAALNAVQIAETLVKDFL